MSKKYFSSDFHLFHYNIIRYCNRPFGSLQEMHETIITKMNSIVQKNDLLYILGDISFYADYKVSNILSRINGKKIIIKGNHDAKKITTIGERFPDTNVIEVCDYKEIHVNNQMVILFHYPIEQWKNKNRGAIHLHGHTHSVPKPRDENLTRVSIAENKTNRRYNVGVDLNDFEPLSLTEIMGSFKEQWFI